MSWSAEVVEGAMRATDPAVTQLTTSLTRALRRLGDVGEPTTAAQIAAQAYGALRREHAPAAERINQVMHYLARLEEAGKEEGATR
ncbi:MAG: hypothetical protein ABIQ17_01050 [Candidatus Limnocylindrales bacterium]